MSSSTCTYCERHLIASMANPIVAITAGTFHWDCWKVHRKAEAKRKACRPRPGTTEALRGDWEFSHFARRLRRMCEEAGYVVEEPS